MLIISVKSNRGKALVGKLIAAAFLMVASPALTAPSQLPPLAELEALCPGMAGSAHRFGDSPDDQTTVNPRPVNQALTTFDPPELTYTSWSNRLAAVTVRAASPDGATNLQWHDGVQEALLAGGWTVLGDSPHRTPLEDGTLFEKAVIADNGTRRLIYEVGSSGAKLLRCGDQALLKIDRDEADGKLAPGSARPDPLQFLLEAALPAPDACDQPDLLEALAKADRIEENSPAFLRFDLRASQASRQARHAERVYRWLQWRMLDSGRIDREELWQIEDVAAPLDIDALEGNFGELLMRAGEAHRAKERGDSKGMCLAMVALMANRVRADDRAAARHQALIVALEDEAHRRAIALD